MCNMTTLPTDPAELARALGARAITGRWWGAADMARRIGVSHRRLNHWLAHGWGADLPRRRVQLPTGGWRVEYWCADPPAPPTDPRAGRDDDGLRAAVVAAVRAAGGPGRYGLWPAIGAKLGLTAEQARHRYANARRLEETNQ
jgi:hypothetical protein